MEPDNADLLDSDPSDPDHTTFAHLPDWARGKNHCDDTALVHSQEHSLESDGRTVVPTQQIWNLDCTDHIDPVDHELKIRTDPWGVAAKGETTVSEDIIDDLDDGDRVTVTVKQYRITGDVETEENHCDGEFVVVKVPDAPIRVKITDSDDRVSARVNPDPEGFPHHGFDSGVYDYTVH